MENLPKDITKDANIVGAIQELQKNMGKIPKVVCISHDFCSFKLSWYKRQRFCNW